MRAKASSTRELINELQDTPPEVIHVLLELVHTVKRVLEAERAKAQAEQVIKQYRERGAGFDWGAVPDADSAEELLEAYRSTFPRVPEET